WMHRRGNLHAPPPGRTPGRFDPPAERRHLYRVGLQPPGAAGGPRGPPLPGAGGGEAPVGGVPPAVLWRAPRPEGPRGRTGTAPGGAELVRVEPVPRRHAPAPRRRRPRGIAGVGSYSGRVTDRPAPAWLAPEPVVERVELAPGSWVDVVRGLVPDGQRVHDE